MQLSTPFSTLHARYVIRMPWVVCRIILKYFCCQQVLNNMFCGTGTVAWVTGRRACQELMRLNLAAVLGAKPHANDHELLFHLMQHTSWH